MSEHEAEFRAEMRASIREIREDIKTLIGFKSWILGACASISAAVSIVIAILFGK